MPAKWETRRIVPHKMRVLALHHPARRHLYADDGRHARTSIKATIPHSGTVAKECAFAVACATVNTLNRGSDERDTWGAAMPLDRTLSVEGLRFETDGPVATVTVDDIAEQNRLTPAALTGLGRMAEALLGRDDLHVVLIRGSGHAYFSTGILNPQLRGSMSKDDVIRLVMEAGAVFDALEQVPQIVVAGINGSVRAGGVELALACDIRIAADHVHMMLPEAKWGGFPGAGGPLRLSRLVGRARALELICTGREIDALEMASIGLVQRVVAVENFDHALLDLVQQIAASGPLAIRGAKRIMAVSEEPGFKAARETSDALRRALEWSSDVDEGILAHHEGRAPRYTGR